MTALLSPAAQARIVRLSRVMEYAAVLGIVLIAGLAIIGAFVPVWTRNLVLAKLGVAGLELPVSAAGRLVVLAIMAVPLGVVIYGLVAVRRMFAAFARGEVFSPYAARQLQLFGASVLAQAPLGPLTGAALSVALTLGDPAGGRLMIGFSSHDYFALIVGGVLLAAATVLREAARLADENAHFV
jgi:hypothetical protein